VDVLTVFRELDAEPLERTAMQPRDEALDHGPRPQFQGAKPRDDSGVEELPVARARRHAYNPLVGGGTASRSRSTIASELMRSDSA
jgi:hypothetical protein